jgi:hypothetical protein
MKMLRLVIISLLVAGAIAACERVVDLTPPDSNSGVPDAAISELDAERPPDASVGGGPDGNDALPPDALPDAF